MESFDKYKELEKNKKFLVWLVIIAIVVILIFIFINKNKTVESTQFAELQQGLVDSTKEMVVEKNVETNICIHITGEVKNEGVIVLEESARIIDAIEAAGGLTDLADTTKTNLAYKLSDGQKVYIPSVNDEKADDYLESMGLFDNINSKVNINTANQTELETLSRCWTIYCTEYNRIS